MALVAILPGLPFSGHTPPPFKQGFFDADLGQTMYFDYEDGLTIVPSTSRPGFLDVIDIDEDTGRRLVLTIAPQPIPGIFHIPPLTAWTRAAYRLFVKGTKIAPITPGPVKPPPSKKPESPIKGNPGIAPGVGPGKKGSFDEREWRDLLEHGGPGMLPVGGTKGSVGFGPSASPVGPITGGPGAWFRGLLNGPTTGGRVVSTASGPNGSTPASGGSSSGNPNARDFDIGGGDKPTSTTSAAGGGGTQATQTGQPSAPAVQGSSTPGGGSQENERRQKQGRYYTVTHHDSKGNPTYTEEKYEETPDPTRNPTGLTGNAAIDWAIMRNAIFQAGFIPAPLGPTRAFTPDNTTDYGAGGEGEIDDLLFFDPIAPVISPAGDYEGRRRYPRNAQRGSMQNPYIEALYPDGSPEYEPPPPDPAEPPPGEPGDPQASIMVKGFSAGVRSASVNLLASGISVRTTRVR
jgi:hypothetical protein